MLPNMIGRLRGIIEEKGAESVLVDVQGVGYEVHVPLGTLASLPNKGETVSLFIHTHVREDELRLFGFESKNDKVAFQTMIKVGGVGPKLALAVLGALSGRDLARVIGDGDTRRLSAIPGIGKKTAERLILELGGKLSSEVAGDRAAPGGRLAELGSALQNLGFKAGQVERVVSELRSGDLKDAPFELLLKEALGMLKER